jgi:hypothetical protein
VHQPPRAPERFAVVRVLQSSRAMRSGCSVVGNRKQQRISTRTHTHTHTQERVCVSELRNGQTTEDHVCVTLTTVQWGLCNQLTLTRLLRCGHRCLPCALNAHCSCDHTFTCGSEQRAHQSPIRNSTQSHHITTHAFAHRRNTHNLSLLYCSCATLRSPTGTSWRRPRRIGREW